MEGVIITSILIGIFVILSIVLLSGRGAFLIAGYNTMSKEEQEKYDVVALCKFMGKVLLGLSACMVLWVITHVSHNIWYFVIGLIAFIAIIIFTLIYANTGNRFKKI